jgi:predicted transcriptional regulator
MADLIYEQYDKFTVIYDVLALVREGATRRAVESAVHLSYDVVGSLLSFLLAQGFVKMRDDGFKITAIGSDFLDEFQGMRKFVQ